MLSPQMKIHPSAIVHPQAQVDSSVVIGPFSVVDPGVEIGANTVVGPHVHLTGITRIGSGNRFHAGCVIGDSPQDLKYADAPTRLVIGDNNVFREHTTVHRSNSLEENTTIGSGNYLMAHSHVGHNSQVGDHVIMANGVLLGGHVTVGDRAILSGHSAVHQFVRIGTLAMAQGGSRLSVDLPPYTIGTGLNELCGLNTIGLRRAGFTQEQRTELKRLYRELFFVRSRSSSDLKQMLEAYPVGPARVLIEFLTASKRGFCSHRTRRTGSSETSAST